MTPNSPSLRIFKTAEEGADALAAFVLEHLAHDLKSQPLATLAVSGGNTPRLLFSRMAAADFDWSRVHIFFVDERCVPPTDSMSNFRMTNETLFTNADIPETNIHRIYGELPPHEAASKYVDDIRALFQLSNDMLPIFDVLHRGMGDEGHTASLFPGEPLINNTTDIAANVWVEKVKMHRVTLLPGVLRAAKRTVLQVVGADKAPAVREVLTGPEDPMTYPCQIASRDSKATWFLDDAAAAQL